MEKSPPNELYVESITTVPSSDPPIAHADPFDTKNPRSLINLVGNRIREGINNIPAEMFEMDEVELMRLAWPPPDAAPFARALMPSWARRCRIAFWEEYDRCQRMEDDCMETAAVYSEQCPKGQFLRQIVGHPARLALLLRPPPIYKMLLAELHELGLQRMQEVLDLPVTFDNGLPNTKLIDMQQRIFTHVDMRKKGAIIQRIDQRNLNVNVDAPAPGALPPGAPPPPPKTMQQLNEELALLEARSKELSQPGVLDVDLTKAAIPVRVNIGVPHEEATDDD